MTSETDISGIKDRLRESLEKAGISMRAASVAAGLGPGYVHSLIKDGTEPTVSKLAQICSKNGISFAYVLLGVDMDPETRRLLELIEADPKRRANILALLGDQ
ncbi:helix-turn-helix transcriptional regulator [Rhodovulum sp. FJ3]|uniref:helix-turn-helix domain-containing protein n=1 Tax=Rhodovulum sp. FJ3 TaxID=3079053 RepID=UPI00293DA751|nr:helix-turn-helix transcriptional regulator [Rhodovulum sp. FJ3]MDV4167787.1 helix-turn-helix transcriptional regulator [Rhodovulum sp. FJ3]